MQHLMQHTKPEHGAPLQLAPDTAARQAIGSCVRGLERCLESAVPIRDGRGQLLPGHHPTRRPLWLDCSA